MMVLCLNTNRVVTRPSCIITYCTGMRMGAEVRNQYAFIYFLSSELFFCIPSHKSITSILIYNLYITSKQLYM